MRDRGTGWDELTLEQRGPHREIHVLRQSMIDHVQKGDRNEDAELSIGTNDARYSERGAVL